MTNTIRILPQSERNDPEHSFVQVVGGTPLLFQGWGPRL